jgi:hypothetical protein
MRARRGGIGIERVDVLQQLARLGEGRARRRIEKSKLGGIAHAPLREIKHEGRQVGREHFRPRIGVERSRFRLVPQPVANAGFGAAGAAAPLVGGGARDAHGLEPRHADIRLEARHPRLPAIDNDPHTLDGQRRLRDRGGEHHLAPPLRRGRDGPVLLARVERAEQSHHIDGGIADALAQKRLGATDFARSGQKDQKRAAFRAQRAHHRVRHLALDGAARVAAEIVRHDRKGAALAFHHRRIAQKLCHPRAVERRRHDQDLQILAQALLRIAREREAEVGIQGAFMEFIEQHGGDAGQFRIVEHKAGEDALGDDLDAGAARHLRAKAHAQAHRLADRLADSLRHPLGGRTRGEAARLQHDNLSAAGPGLLRQHQWNPRGLAGARRRHQHGSIAPAQSLVKARQGGINGQRRIKKHGRFLTAP